MTNTDVPRGTKHYIEKIRFIIDGEMVVIALAEPVPITDVLNVVGPLNLLCLRLKTTSGFYFDGLIFDPKST